MSTTGLQTEGTTIILVITGALTSLVDTIYIEVTLNTVDFINTQITHLWASYMFTSEGNITILSSAQFD